MGKKLGSIDSNGAVRNKNGKKIGTSSGSKNATAVKYFFKK